MEHDKKREPRIERLPIPPKFASGIPPEALHEWHIVTDSVVKYLGDVFNGIPENLCAMSMTTLINVNSSFHMK
jgi:hypothetical protein